MKISVCGKGGSGKSTIVSLLAERFAAAGKEVLIIDSDESNLWTAPASQYGKSKGIYRFFWRERGSSEGYDAI